MTRNLGILGLVVAVVLAMSAFGASSASAVGEFTSTVYPQHVVSWDVEPNDQLTGTGSQLTCAEQTFTADLGAPSPAASFVPQYGTCRTLGAAFDNVTTTTNQCVFEFTVTTTASADEHRGSVHLKCPTGKSIEFHHFSTQANHANGIQSCTLTVSPQTAPEEVVYTNRTFSEDIEIHAAFTLPTQTHGPCVFGLTVNSTTTNDVTATLETTSGDPIHIG